MAKSDLSIEIVGLEPVLKKFQNAPKTIQREMGKAMDASFLVVQENIPAYPPKRENQKTPYIRTGNLGRSLGVSQGGSRIGNADIQTVSYSGGNVVGKFGTKLAYARYVIDEEQQAYMHKQWWWTLDFVARKAKSKIIELWGRFIKRAMDA